MNAILSRALEQTTGDQVTHAELLDLARELGLSADAIQSAAAEVDAQKSDVPILRRWRRKALRGFLIHGVAYVFSIATLALLLATSGEPLSPAVVIMLLWGIGLASHGLAGRRAPSRCARGPGREARGGGEGPARDRPRCSPTRPHSGIP